MRFHTNKFLFYDIRYDRIKSRITVMLIVIIVVGKLGDTIDADQCQQHQSRGLIIHPPMMVSFATLFGGAFAPYPNFIYCAVRRIRSRYVHDLHRLRKSLYFCFRVPFSIIPLKWAASITYVIRVRLIASFQTKDLACINGSLRFNGQCTRKIYRSVALCPKRTQINIGRNKGVVFF